jgi:hypothetical protein
MNTKPIVLFSIACLLAIISTGQNNSPRRSSANQLKDTVGIDPAKEAKAIAVAKSYLSGFINKMPVDSIIINCEVPMLVFEQDIPNATELLNYHKWLIKQWSRTSSKHYIKSAKALWAIRKNTPGEPDLDLYNIEVVVSVPDAFKRETYFFLIVMTEQPKIRRVTAVD